jgi:hypothetical protein
VSLADSNYDLSPALTLTGAATGATINSAAFSNPNGRGVIIGISTTVDAGSYLINVQGQDVASGTWYTLASTAAIVSVVFQTLTVYPGLTAVANATITGILPKTWRIQAVVTTGPITATVGASVIA